MNLPFNIHFSHDTIEEDQCKYILTVFTNTGSDQTLQPSTIRPDYLPEGTLSERRTSDGREKGMSSFILIQVSGKMMQYLNNFGACPFHGCRFLWGNSLAEVKPFKCFLSLVDTDQKTYTILYKCVQFHVSSSCYVVYQIFPSVGPLDTSVFPFFTSPACSILRFSECDTESCASVCSVFCRTWLWCLLGRPPVTYYSLPFRGVCVRWTLTCSRARHTVEHARFIFPPLKNSWS